MFAGVEHDGDGATALAAAGQVAVTQAALPLLRRGDRPGRVV